MRIPLWLKVGWTIWLLIWAPLYWRQYGAQNFLYFCDLGNILIGVGLWLESAFVFSWVGCGVLLFQTLYIIDLSGALLTGHHLIGGTEYLFDPHLSLAIRLLTLFHVVTPPLLLWLIHRVGYDSRGWKMQALMTWIVVPINHYWRPEYDVNWARGLFYREQHVLPGIVYLLVYLVTVTFAVYWPTHLLLAHWARAREDRQPGM